MRPIHHPNCPVMDEESCHTVGGVDPMHDRFTFGKCRCGKPCYCDRLDLAETRGYIKGLKEGFNNAYVDEVSR